MNKSFINLYWIGYYFGQNCILHPDTGRWILAGCVDNEVYLRRNIGTPEEDCISYPISEVQFILKFANPFLIKSLSKLPLFHDWINNKAMEGYWVFDCKSINVIYEGNGSSS